jgi:uncharacterized protein YktB (UPF0637 family)
MLEPVVLRRLKYYEGPRRDLDGELLYFIRDGECFFFGITKHTRSTINATEEIVAAISHAEQTTPDRLTFFHIQIMDGKILYQMFRFWYDSRQPLLVTQAQIPNSAAIRNLEWDVLDIPKEIEQIFASAIRVSI